MDWGSSGLNPGSEVGSNRAATHSSGPSADHAPVLNSKRPLPGCDVCSASSRSTSKCSLASSPSPWQTTPCHNEKIRRADDRLLQRARQIPIHLDCRQIRHPPRRRQAAGAARADQHSSQTRSRPNRLVARLHDHLYALTGKGLTWIKDRHHFYLCARVMCAALVDRRLRKPLAIAEVTVVANQISGPDLVVVIEIRLLKISR